MIIVTFSWFSAMVDICYTEYDCQFLTHYSLSAILSLSLSLWRWVANHDDADWWWHTHIPTYVLYNIMYNYQKKIFLWKKWQTRRRTFLKNVLRVIQDLILLRWGKYLNFNFNFEFNLKSPAIDTYFNLILSWIWIRLFIVWVSRLFCMRTIALIHSMTDFIWYLCLLAFPC